MSIASANIIPKAVKVANVRMYGLITYLSPVSVVVNGRIKNTNYFYHKLEIAEDVAPGFDTPGQFGGECCMECGVVLEEPQEIAPTGPVVYAVSDSNKTLTVSGGISDNEAAEGRTYLAVYDKDNKLLDLRSLTEYNQSDFSISIENMYDAHTVKLLRWEALSLTPLYDAVKVSVKSE